MIKAAFLALGDLASAEFRTILARAVGLTIALFAGLLVGLEVLLWFLTLIPWPWLETIAAIGAGLGLLVLFFFLMAPVTSLFAGLYLDRVAALVEQRHYPSSRPGVPLSALRGFTISIQFAIIVLIVNLLALPLVFTGIGVFVLIAVNAYLLSREYFEMAAMRHMEPAAARALRRANAAWVFVAGLIPALLSAVPVVNLAVPLFATSYFVHLFKQVPSTSA